MADLAIDQYKRLTLTTNPDGRSGKLAGAIELFYELENLEAGESDFPAIIRSERWQKGEFYWILKPGAAPSKLREAFIHPDIGSLPATHVCLL